MPGELRDYAIVIGINKYSQLQRLTSPVGDAVKFMEWLRAEDGGGLTDTKQIRHYIEDKPFEDPMDAQPNQNDIDKRLRDLGIKKGEKLGRRLYFYFSGHGFARESDDVGMLMANASPTALNRNIGLRGYRELFRTIPYFEQVVFILDCCREATNYNFDTQKPTDGIDALRDNYIAVSGAITNPAIADLIILGASHGGKSLALELTDGDGKRGLLTQALLEALEGEPKAADQRTGEITAFSLRQYVEKRVKELSAGTSEEQKPEILDSKSDGIVFRKIELPEPPKIKVRIKVDNSIKGDLKLFDKDKTTIFSRQDIEQNNCEIELEKREFPPYILFSTNPKNSKNFDLSEVEGNEYEVSFP